MRIPTVIVISAASLVAGYSLHMAQERIASPGFSDAEKPESAREVHPPIEPIFELNEVQARRRELDEKIITVVGGVCMRFGHPYLVPDDDVALLKEFAGEGRYFLSLPEWRFRDLPGTYPGIVVTGRFGRLDGVGYDSLSPIASISWKSTARGSMYDSRIDEEEMKTINNGPNKPAQTDGDKPVN